MTTVDDKRELAGTKRGKKKWQVAYWSDQVDGEKVEGFDTYEEAITRKYQVEKKLYVPVRVRLRP